MLSVFPCCVYVRIKKKILLRLGDILPSEDSYCSLDLKDSLSLAFQIWPLPQSLYFILLELLMIKTHIGILKKFMENGIER